MKRILYDIGHLTLVLLSLGHPSDQDLSWKGSPHPKIEKNKCVLKWLLSKIQCFWAYVAKLNLNSIQFKSSEVEIAFIPISPANQPADRPPEKVDISAFVVPIWTTL